MTVTTQFLYRESNGILLNFQGGKLDPKCSYGNEECEKKITYKSFEGGDPWFRGINFLRLHIGKNHPPKLAQERKIEQIFKQLKRDNISALNKEYIDISSIKIPKPPEFFYHFDRINILCFHKDYDKQETLSFIVEQIDQGMHLIRGEIDGFLASEHLNFGEYQEEKIKKNLIDQSKTNAKISAINDCYLKFFANFSIEPSQLFAEQLRRDPDIALAFDGKSCYDKLSVEQKCSFLQTAARKISIDKFDLKVSKWKPTDEIAVLIEELALHGPLCIGASYGRYSYAAKEPYKLEKPFGGRIISYYKSSERILNARLFHAKLLIGALMDGKNGHVYYIDPLEAINPDQEQSIYATSYKSMTEGILDLEGVLRKVSPHSGYAVYHQ